MKKIVALVSVLFAIVVPVQSQAAESKSLVVIDSYFDSRITGYECTTIQNTVCQNKVVKSFPTSLTDNLNHGNAMLAVAKKQNPAISLIGLRAASTNNSASDVNAGTFIEALKWVSKNSDRVSAVSISRYFNGTSACSPSSINTQSYGGIKGADLQIRSLIAELKTKGIPVFASTGNKAGKAVDYPACILDTNSVSVGSMNSKGNIISLYQYDSNTDYFATADVYSYVTTFGLVPNTTSAGTVAVASQYASGNALASKVVPVLP